MGNALQPKFSTGLRTIGQAKEGRLDPKVWKETVEDESESVLKRPKPHVSDSRHACIIHGYNKETGEIAFTDSWGENIARDGFRRRSRTFFPRSLLGDPILILRRFAAFCMFDLG